MSDDIPAIKEVFFAALDRQSPEEMNAYLDEACRDDPALRPRVEQLLRAHRNAGKFLGGRPPDDGTIDHFPINERPGAVIGSQVDHRRDE